MKPSFLTMVLGAGLLLGCAVVFPAAIPGVFAAEAGMDREPSGTKPTVRQAVVPIVVERAEKLAGIKLVLKYDADLLSYRGAEKTPQTSALMHLVNDKQPGRLVVVMAGAVGVSGDALPVVNLRFEVRNRSAEQGALPIEIVETQLMNEKLEELRSPVSVGPEREKP